VKALWLSFRFRLLVGSLLWTAGLLYIAHVGSVLVMFGWEAFRNADNVLTMLAIALALLVLGVSLVRNGLSSFNELRRRLSSVRSGHDKQVGGAYPTEVQPLVDDLNALLAHRDHRMREALTKAGDLAHGLKTPLAVLTQEAEHAEAVGQSELAAVINHQVERMRRQMDYHLAHARAAASGATPGLRCAVVDSAEGLARTLRRLHAGRGLSIEVAVSPNHAVRGQREDVDEMLGNLLDNACKWAKARVSITSCNGDGLIVITVDDDGMGLAEELRIAVLQRGVRADELAPGSGFGLAIVRDLAELHGGSIVLGGSPLGGLRATLRLPPAA
jgi:signal transduction histidine kinase